MKKYTYLSIFLFLTSCVNETVYETPQEVTVAGKILNLEAYDHRIHFIVSRIGIESNVFEVETDSIGNFTATFETYVPTNVQISFSTEPWWIMVYPKDSVYVEFDGNAKERASLLKSVRYSGDSHKLNQEAAKIQELYFRSSLSNISAINEVYTKYEQEQFLLYYDTLTVDYQNFHDNYVDEYGPGEEGKSWAKNFLDFRRIDVLANYPLNHRINNQLSQDDWNVTSDYYTPIQDVLPIQTPMFLCGTFLSGYVNRYLYAFVGERVRNEDVVKEFAEQNYEGMTPGLTDSLMIDGIIRHTPDELLREMVLTEYLVATFRSNDITSFENNINVVDEYITHNFLKEPLYEKYRQVKRLNENPLPDADAILSSPDSLTVEAILSDIANKNTGKVIYLDTWATWCSPCKSEMPNSKRLMETMKDRNVAFVFVCVDSEERLWKVSLAEFQIGGQHYFLNQEQSDVFRQLYDIEGIPHYFLFNKKGELIEKGSHLRPNTMMEKIEVLL